MTNLPILDARKLLLSTNDELWQNLTGKFHLKFDDKTILTNEGETLYSNYAWDFFRTNPTMPFLSKYHVRSLLKENEHISIPTTNRLMTNVIWDVHDWVIFGVDPRDTENLTPDISKARVNPREYREYLARKTWEILNTLYNDLIIRCQPYIVSINVEDIKEVLEYPALFKAIEEGRKIPIEDSIEKVYDVVSYALKEDPALDHNILSRLIKSKTVKEDQLKQCVGVRGFITDIDSELFPVPIMENLMTGIKTAYDSQIESRSAAKSVAYSEEPLEQSEYFSRRQQMVSQTYRRIHEGDCGSTETLSWLVESAKDLERLEGKNYIDDEGRLRYVTRKDKYLIGKTLKLRTIFHCQHTDPYGSCSTCFGQMALANFKTSNIGQDTAVSILSDIGQRVLSVKHLDGSSKIDSLELDLADRKYLRVGKDGSSYQLSPDLKTAVKIELLLEPYMVPGITDIKDAKNAEDLFLTRVSKTTELGITVTEKNKEHTSTIRVGLERRVASFSLDLIKLIRERGWVVNQDGNYVFDITGFDFDKKLLITPLRHFNMGDLAKAIARILEASTEDEELRDEGTTLNEFLSLLYETVNSRLEVNFAVIEAITYSIMIVSAKDNDYSLPKPWTAHGFGVKNKTYRHRSASAEMAFEKQQMAILDPSRYIYTNVVDHQMDTFIDPQGVVDEFFRFKRSKKSFDWDEGV